jgi:putative phosphoribosyl transferase
VRTETVRIPADGAWLAGTLEVADGTRGLVLFAHGSGSSRLSPRNRSVAAVLQGSGHATLLFDLLTEDEDAADRRTRGLRFDIELLGRRLLAATDWVLEEPTLAALPLGYFGASTGAAAALVAAADRPRVRAVVSRGGRPDLAGDALGRVPAPTLLIVGSRDETVLQLNREAAGRMRGTVELVEVPGATHLFEEPGALDQVAGLAAGWFDRFLA